MGAAGACDALTHKAPFVAPGLHEIMGKVGKSDRFPLDFPQLV